MHAKRVAAIVLSLSAMLLAAETLPTAEELQQMVDKKDWAGLLAGTSRVLALKGTATAGYDRADLWTKKGEAQLQSAQFLPASQSFAKAAEEKGVAPDQSDKALAMSRLAKKSDAKGYKTPSRQGPMQTFDVLDPMKRNDALAALFTADAADAQQNAEKMKVVTDAKPLIDMAKQIADLRPLDRVVNKSSDKSDAIEKIVAENYVTQTKSWSTAAAKNLDAISASANEMVQQRTTDRLGRVTYREHRQGLTSGAQTDLQKYMQRAQQLAGTYTSIQQSMSEAGKTAIKPAETAIQGVYDQAKSIKAEAARPN
ncbi:MAG: hypothetical protein JWM57_2867 [Phycisphaerales bacterium]|nr:hypothetical protein [Phycisphaerales bacterium]